MLSVSGEDFICITNFKRHFWSKCQQLGSSRLANSVRSVHSYSGNKVEVETFQTIKAQRWNFHFLVNRKTIFPTSFVAIPQWIFASKGQQGPARRRVVCRAWRLDLRQQRAEKHGIQRHHGPRRSNNLLDGTFPRCGCDPRSHLQRTSHHQLPVREGTAEPPIPRRARAAKISERRRTLHRLQALRSHLPGPGHHHWGWGTCRRQPTHDPLRYWYD